MSARERNKTMTSIDNTSLSDLSKITIKEKQTDFLNLIYNFSKKAIEIIDKGNKRKRPQLIEYEYIDLVAEAFFTVQSFCVLMGEGLVSNASAVLRIALEQASIITLVSSNNSYKDAFLEMKREKNKYYSLSEEEQKEYRKSIKKQFGSDKVKQYFDYGWCKKNDKPAFELKTVCEFADLSDAHTLVEDVINSFAHGQISFYRLVRQNNGVDVTFINHLFSTIGFIFFRMVNVLPREYGKDVLSRSDKAEIDKAYALFSDFTSRFFEESTLKAINEKEVRIISFFRNVHSLNQLLIKYDESIDYREQYFLSQAYIHYYRQIVAGYICHYYQTDETINLESISLRNIFAIFKPEPILQEFKKESSVDVNELLEYLDTRGNDWILSNEDQKYIVASTKLVTILYKMYK